MLYTISFYNSKILTLNISASLFKDNNFSLKKVGQSLETVVKHLKTVVKHFEALCSDLYFSG